MREYLELGSTPCLEKCCQVGSNTSEEIRAECFKYVDMLRKRFPIPADMQEGNSRFGVKSFPHDFGSYSEAVIYYDNKDDKSVGFAFFVESEFPENWNDDDVLHYVHQEHEVAS